MVIQLPKIDEEIQFAQLLYKMYMHNYLNRISDRDPTV